MGKRSAADEPPGASPSKRQHLPQGDSPYMQDSDDEAASSYICTPSPEPDAETPVTTATTPRPKFPSDLKTLACTWPGCPKTFNRPARLRDHLNSHTNSRPFKCPYEGCDKDYIEDKHLKQHVKAVHTHERKYVCQREGCGKSFVTGTRLNRHQAVHEGADRFRCSDCGQSFRKKETLHKHVRKEHLDMPAHECPDPSCTEAFGTKSRLKRHFDKLHGEIKFWCTECGLKAAEEGTENRVGFTTEVLLQEHLKKEHQDCIFCEYKSSSRYELEQHIETHHSGKSVEERKTHACTFDGCSKKFTKKSNLKVHIRTAHQGVRFVCGEAALAGPDFEGWSNSDGCGAKYGSKAGLEDHVRFLHLGHVRTRMSRPAGNAPDVVDDLSGAANQAKHTIPCPHCDDMFIRYHDLDVHLARDHDPADPTSLLAQAPARPAFEQNHPAQPAWPADMAQDDIFAAQMDYGPLRDEWLDDEANILLLARDPPPDHASGPTIDPALAGP
ncbi:C2H2 transcription factor (TFIIIA) [Hirsutella rhossiliensis]|uniref:C2H2 transcription factor (TFIIIA) n=1 Tax=Hirsutella rhossiliensis TaxID=111463 RepID=A0A9P8N4R7_9HYPO|nr:C2H2 transcription factor (TFIIIA) [Hirsutella rhossiliensis]KAH0965921.1 C2H2 transcription factor (TFIIIA) [Hirsutella rhossiliensis]